MPPSRRLYVWGITGIVADTLAMCVSIFLYCSMTLLDVREEEAVRRFWYSLFKLCIFGVYFLLLFGMAMMFGSFTFMLMVFTDNLYLHLWVMDVFLSLIHVLIVFAGVFALGHIWYIVWQRSPTRTLPNHSKSLLKETLPSTVESWSRTDVVQWIESGVSPKSNIAGLQMRVGAASSARFDTLEASERAALIGTAKSQRLDGEVLKAFGSMSHIKDELDISLGTAKTLWLAIMGANAEAQIATMRHMQCVVEAIQSDLRWRACAGTATNLPPATLNALSSKLRSKLNASLLNESCTAFRDSCIVAEPWAKGAALQ